MKMVLFKPIIAVIFFFILLDSNADCNDSSGNEDGSSIPMIASGKRMHNIMRFGKRPAGGHSLIHFGKRDNPKVPQHSFLYFGKRGSYPGALPNLMQYLSRQDGSSKRGHSIMRFGKRDTGSSNFVGRPEEEAYDGYIPINENDMDDDKRGGHSMMYFGKRGGHNMMYFGKRGGHSMLYFGKRIPGHSILSFGKRDDDKRAHSMIHFGKREGEDPEDSISSEEKRGGHSMFHFGKREDDDDDDDASYPDEIKRTSHSMIHFGKRDLEDESVPFFWNPAASEREQNFYHYGKKAGPKNNHAMIHFGKRNDDKRSHSMIHFGKRSVVENIDSGTGNQSKSLSTKAVARVKRDLEEGGNGQLLTMVPYESGEVDDIPDEELENIIKASPENLYQPSGIIPGLLYPDFEQPLLPINQDYPPILKKEASKNMFLRFG